MPKQLLAEKYRPKTLDSYVFSSTLVKEKVEQWVSDKEIPNLLFISAPGCGKTTLSRILINELGVEPLDVKSVNASLESGIGFIREELEPWVKKRGFGPIKIVQLEEMDRFSQDAQKALRQICEDYSDRVRFIGTANYESGISDFLHSRFQVINMDGMQYDDALNYICDIVDGEELIVEEDNDLISHLDAYFPDLRKVINSIDQHVDGSKKLHALEAKSYSNDVSEWEEIWTNGDVSESMDVLLELTEHADMNNYEWFYEVMYSNHHQFKNEEDAIIKISTYLDRAQRSANQRLHLKACLYHIFFVEE